MRIVAWNVAHQARERPTPPALIGVVAAMQPDVLVMTEYVHGASRASLLEGITATGLPHFVVSDRVGHNQVLIASRVAMRLGDVIGSAMPDHAGVTNFQRVVLNYLGMEVVGPGAPAYRSRRELSAYCAQLEPMLAALRDRRIVVIGDVNADPDHPAHCGTPSLVRLRAAGWHLPQPEGAWSFESKRMHRSCIDHVLVAPSLPFPTARYIIDLDGVRIAGQMAGASSDHAPLVVELAL